MCSGTLVLFLQEKVKSKSKIKEYRGNLIALLITEIIILCLGFYKDNIN